MAKEMKCVCGYTPKYEFDPEFIRSKDYVEFDLKRPNSVMSFEPNSVLLYACPKCGTLKIEI